MAGEGTVQLWGNQGGDGGVPIQAVVLLLYGEVMRIGLIELMEKESGGWVM